MYIKSISLSNFKKFDKLSVAFPSDITVVKGPNEQGKSSLLAALLAGLFYDPKKSNQQISSLKSWQSDKLYELVTGIEHNGEDIVLSKNFETKELLLENKTTGKKLNTFAAIGDELYTIGALRSLALFENTACVRHDALAQMTEGKKEISQALQALMTASGENVSSEKILKKLGDGIASLQRGTKQQAKTPGLLKQLDADLAVLAGKKTAIASALADLAAKSAHAGELAALERISKREYDAKESQYQKNIAYFKTMQELEKLHAQADKANADYNALMDIENKKGYLSVQQEKMKTLKAIDWEKLYAQREALSVKKEKQKNILEEAERLAKEKKKTKIHVKISHVAVSALLAALGFLGFVRVELFAAWVLSAVAFAYSFVFRRGIVVHTGVQLGAESESLAHEIAVLEKQHTSIMDENGVSSIEELVQKVKRYNEFGVEREKLESKEEGILRGGRRDNFKKERTELLKRIAIEEAKISDEEKASPPSPSAQRLLEVDRERHKQELDKLDKEIAHVNAILHSQYSREDLAETEEEMEYKQAQKVNAERKLETLQVLADALAEAQIRTIAQSRSVIEQYMRRYLPAITDGRYTNVKIKDDLSFEVWSDEKKGMIVPEENLSKGTIDQFYLVARFAVLALLNKGVKSPVLLDDPFSAFDASRREKAREMLQDLSGAFQIILFTHSSDYDGWGTVVQL